MHIGINHSNKELSMPVFLFFLARQLLFTSTEKNLGDFFKVGLVRVHNSKEFIADIND